jgi:ArsR family transcriptional regulator
MIVDTTSERSDGTRPVLPSCCGSVSGNALSEREAIDLAHALKALADPVRLRLVSIVATSPAGEVCACDLPGAVDRSQPTVSHHLSLLVDAGVLEREQRGKWAWFRLRPQRLDELSDVLAPTNRPVPPTN